MRAALVCEDDDDVRALVCAVLQAEGYDTVAVDGVRDALALVAGRAFDVVVTDVRLPDGDGLDVCRAAAAAGTTTVAMTATVDSALAAEVARCPAVLLHKPFTLAALLGALVSGTD